MPQHRENRPRLGLRLGFCTCAGGMCSKGPSMRLQQGAKCLLVHVDGSAAWFCLTWDCLKGDNVRDGCLQWYHSTKSKSNRIEAYQEEWYHHCWGYGDPGRNACQSTMDIAHPIAQMQLGTSCKAMLDELDSEWLKKLQVEVTVGVSINGVPWGTRNGWFIRDIPLKWMMTRGYPCLRKPPCGSNRVLSDGQSWHPGDRIPYILPFITGEVHLTTLATKWDVQNHSDSFRNFDYYVLWTF